MERSLKMKAKTLILFSFLVTLFCFSATIGLANVWIDENFDGTGPSIPPIWVQGNGAGAAVAPADATLDIYVQGGALGGKTITGSPLVENGSKVTTRYFDGTASYRMTSSQGISVSSNISNPANGAYVILQFAVNVAPIPAAGNVAIFRYEWDTNSTAPPSPDYSFYVKLVSNGTKVDIIAGEDLKNITPLEANIGSLNATADWKFITMVMQNNAPPATYTQVNLPSGSLSQLEGVAFYCSSETQGHFVPMIDTTNKTFKGWLFNVSSGNVYLDTLYWESGMDNTAYIDATQINIRKFNYSGSPSSVNDWELY